MLLWFIALVIFLIIVWIALIPWMLARMLSIYLKATVRIGGIHGCTNITQFSLSTQGFKIRVSSLRLTSSVFSSEANNLLTIIATGVSVTLSPEDSETKPAPSPSSQESKVLRKLMLVAPFFGLQVRGFSLVLTRLGSLPSCHLVLELGELRLDSAVIYRTKLSLTTILYQGRMYVEHTVNSCKLLDTTFAFQASCQALVYHGRVCSVEESKLDIDGFSVQLSSALFQHIVQTKSKYNEVSPKQPGRFTAFIPRQAEIKAEGLSLSLEHTDRVSSLQSDLQLLYMSVKCTEPPRPGYLPDSHLSMQLSAFRVYSGSVEEKVFELSKFQILVQKEGNLLNSDTQIHECKGRYSSLLLPWVSPLSWLFKKLDKGERDRLGGGETEPNLLQGLVHQHQLDAWNSDLTIVDSVEWEVCLHHLQGGLVGGISQLSVRRVTCNSDSSSVLLVGQVDFRLCKPQEKNQIDLMVTDTNFHYTPALFDLAAKIHDVVRPLLLQFPASAPSSKPPASLALLVSQTRVTVPRELTSLHFELRELEAAGDRLTGEFTLSGLKFSMENTREHLIWLLLPKIVVNRKPVEVKVSLEERVKLVWKPNLQVALETMAKELSRFKALSVSAKPSDSSELEPSAPASVLHLSVSDKISVHLGVADHTMKLRVPNLTAKYARAGLSWVQTPNLGVKLDSKQVLYMENILLSSVEHSDKLTSERRRMEGGTVKQNKCLVFAASSLSFTEPYQFNFNEVFFEEFIGVFKWLKAKHLVKKNTNWDLARDILINIKHFKMELSDDPFEVRLRDNYELRKDEYTESQTRLKVLEERIAEFRRKNLMFPSEKVEELLQNLKKKNAEIYIQRVRKVYQTSEPRTRLLDWEMRGLEVMLLADPSMHGRSEVIRHLKEFDCFSPWPPDSQLDFSTLWCRWVKVESDTLTVSLRDFPQNLLDIQTLALWGKLAGAEASPNKRAVRQHRVRVGFPYEDEMVDRNMVPLKFYYDLACDVETLSLSYGLCWEPTLTQCSLAGNYLTGGSKDPSTPLPFWDKVRLLFHGRFLLAARTHRLLLHASLDPYNTTEEMDVSWTDMELVWSEAEIVVNGTLDIYVRTASKYDDGHLLHLPNLNFAVKMDWVCLANPKDHHSVTPCAPDKLPEYSSNQEHDSFRAFRSSNLDISVHLESRSSRGTKGERPKLDMFSSTLRWFENLKFIFSGATRPIRRGDVFHNCRPKKPHFSRHFKKVDFSVSLHQFQVNYWTSFSQNRGILLNVARGIHLAAHHQLIIVPYTDGLKRRARADWTVSFISCDLTASDIWIQSAINTEPETVSNPPSPSSEAGQAVPQTPSSSRETMNSRISRMESMRNMERSFFFCVEKVLYTRNSCEELGKPTHRLVIHGARGAWTQSNRDMFFALYDSWRRAQILRRNVSSDALKLFYTEKPQQAQEKTPFTSPTPVNPSNSPFSWGASSKAAGSMLDRLLQETEGGATPTAYSEDMSGEEEVKHSLEAMAACTKEDIVHWNWSIELVNSQLLMRGIETQGYVIMSAARASVSQNLHRPVWKERALLSKTTWSGGLESMQYYATVSEEGTDLDNIMWLTLDNIGEGEEGRVPGPAGVVGSGKAVGGVVSKVVGVTDSPGNLGIQLQRVVSRCKAEFFYVSYGDTALDDVEASLGGVCKFSGSPVGEENWNETETAVNAFTLVHHDLNICTNSLQYVMLLDIVNNLLLYSEPTLKARTDRYLRMRYQFMLEIDTIEEHRKKIIQLQNQLRQLVCTQREKEKAIYLLSGNKGEKRKRLETEASDIKDKLQAMSEDLDMMIRCYRETQMSYSQRQSALRGQKEGAKLRRRGEICFSKAAWRLTEIDGQLGIADINISNFLFTRSSMSDDSVENLLEMGWVNVRNLLPNQLYENVLTPTELKRDIPVDRQRTVRIYSRERARVGGISVKDHFEINVSPLTIGITAHFYKKMMTFAFPEKDAEIMDEEVEAEKKQRKRPRKCKNASFYVECPSTEKDDVEKMKERAERNKLFIYIKIPEVPIKVSYKGEKEKNQILDVVDFQLQVPTLEYHNVTWTWLDLLLAVKSRTRESMVTQAIKQKFLRNKSSTREEQAPGEEEKARMLLGSSSVLGSSKPVKRFFPLMK